MGWSAVALLAAVMGAASRLSRMEVHGDSMRPAVEPGDRLLVLRTGRFHPGDVVVVRDPRDPSRTVVKRVAVDSGPRLTLRGDNLSASTDSRVFGDVERSAVRGRVVYRYAPAARRGRLTGPLVR